ncbi:hypothetical protein [Zhongshania aquimaris]|uniref:Uncharacterized protein n=1 Tax=Zhongshania aquimaris TaxID=2857107 RepID=A0ABS6VTN5_9GAMM|nr:hypothetical protein [Zhongshania aquimaris]MBW2941683.1 hypothetical protein [Zhongshania aquimaris]
MNNIKNVCTCLIQYVSKLHYLILLGCGLLPCTAFGDNWGKESVNDITLPRHEKLSYRPTITFCIERDESTGKFQAFNANQARFNRVWMEQNNAKHGSDASKALIKMGIKALYKSFHNRSAGAKRFLPDEEGRVAVSQFTEYDADYKVHLSSDSITLGLALAF